MYISLKDKVVFSLHVNNIALNIARKKLHSVGNRRIYERERDNLFHHRILDGCIKKICTN